MRLRFDRGRPELDLTDPKLLLSASQQRALANDRELLVSAGAGSGKTSTLSYRYSALLLELAWGAVLTDTKARIDSILVLTFTDKAANEMAMRCEAQFIKLRDAFDESAEDAAEHLGAKKCARSVVSGQERGSNCGTCLGMNTTLLSFATPSRGEQRLRNIAVSDCSAFGTVAGSEASGTALYDSDIDVCKTWQGCR